MNGGEGAKEDGEKSREIMKAGRKRRKREDRKRCR